MIDVDYKALDRMLDRSPALKGAVLRILRNEADMGEATLEDIGNTLNNAVNDHELFEAKLQDQPLPLELKRRADDVANDVLPKEPRNLPRRRRSGPRSGS